MLGWMAMTDDGSMGGENTSDRWCRSRDVAIEPPHVGVRAASNVWAVTEQGVDCVMGDSGVSSVALCRLW